jgi:hypothetical protein
MPPRSRTPSAMSCTRATWRCPSPLSATAARRGRRHGRSARGGCGARGRHVAEHATEAEGARAHHARAALAADAEQPAARLVAARLCLRDAPPQQRAALRLLSSCGADRADAAPALPPALRAAACAAAAARLLEGSRLREELENAPELGVRPDRSGRLLNKQARQKSARLPRGRRRLAGAAGRARHGLGVPLHARRGAAVAAAGG